MGVPIVFVTMTMSSASSDGGGSTIALVNVVKQFD